MAVTTDTLDENDKRRRELAAVTLGVTRAIDTTWASSWDALRPRWIDAVQTAAEEQPDQPVAHAPSVRSLLHESAGRLDDLHTAAAADTARALPALVTVTLTTGRRIALSQLPPRASWPWRDADRMALAAITRRTAGQVTSLHHYLPAEAEKRMKAELVRGITVGDNPRRAAQRMVDGLEAEFIGGRNRALVIARTEMLDAHRAVDHATRLANADLATGWVWTAQLDSRTCGACLAMHGTTYPPGHPGPEGHQQCRCTAVTTTKSWRDLGFDIPEPPPLIPDARSWFNAQPPTVQHRILGARVTDALHTGRIDWADLATRKHTPGWRDSIHTTPTRVLLAKAGTP